MAKAIVKTLTTTRVSFKTVSVEAGVPCFVDQTDAVFSGQLDKDKVERLLKGRLGKDATIVITNIDAGQHRYEMSMEEFVLNAHVVDEDPDDEDDEDAQPSEDEPSESAAEPGDVPSVDELVDEQDAADSGDQNADMNPYASTDAF